VHSSLEVWGRNTAVVSITNTTAGIVIVAIAVVDDSIVVVN